MKTPSTATFFFLLFCFCSRSIAQPPGWDYSARYMKGGTDEFFAVLWIGDPDKPVRGVLLTSMTRNEPDFNFDPDIRQACTEMGLAQVFFYIDYVSGTYDRGPIGVFNPENGDDTILFTALKDLAQLSGKPEIEHAPWLTFGHSTSGIFARNIAWWKPERMFGVIFYKTGGYNPPDWMTDPQSTAYQVPDTSTFVNIPWLSVAARQDKSDQDDWEASWKIMRKEMIPWRQRGCLMSEIVEPAWEEGHSIWRPFNGPFMAKWIRKAAERKIPYDTVATDGPVHLLHVENSSGVLSDTLIQVLIDSSRIRDNLLRFYEDVDEEDRGSRFWHFDADMALAWVNYHHVDHEQYVPEQDTTLSGRLISVIHGMRLSDEFPYQTTTVYQAPGLYEVARYGEPGWVDSEAEFNIISFDRLIKIDKKLDEDTGSYSGYMLTIFNGADALMIDRIVSEDPWQPDIFEMWAADVNLDGMVDSVDLQQVIDRALGKMPAYSQERQPGQSTDWVFWDSTNIRYNKETKISGTFPADDGIGYSRHRIPRISNRVMMPYDEPGNPYPIYEDGIFYGILLGDLQRSYPPIDVEWTPDCIVVNTGKIKVYGSDSIHIPLYAMSPMAINSADIIISFEGERSSFLGVRPGQDMSLYSNLVDNISGHRLTIVSFSRDSISQDKPFAWLRFLGSSFEDYEILPGRGFIDGSGANTYIRDTLVSTGSLSNSNAIKLYPVPAEDELNIQLRVEQDIVAQVRILDLSGRTVLVRDFMITPGRTVTTLDITSLPSGVYITEIQLGKEVFVSRFVK